jgi:hypothetical protein
MYTVHNVERQQHVAAAVVVQPPHYARLDCCHWRAALRWPSGCRNTHLETPKVSACSVLTAQRCTARCLHCLGHDAGWQLHQDQQSTKQRFHSVAVVRLCTQR